MKTICLKFPDKATAHSFLYGQEGEPLFENIADNSKTGLCVEVKVVEDAEVWIHPADGSYVADIRDSRYVDTLPVELKPYIIYPNINFRKHKFFGEE